MYDSFLLPGRLVQDVDPDSKSSAIQLYGTF